MKRILTALGLIVITSNAFAGEFSYSIEGTSDTLYGYSDVSERYEKKDDNNKLLNNTEINFIGEYELDEDTKLGLHLNLMAGFNKENRDYNNGRWGKEVYGTLESKYGQVILGEDYNAAYKLGEATPRIGALGISNSGIQDFIANPNWRRSKHHTSYKTLNSTSINTDGVAPKVTYITPEFYDTLIGFTYVPDIDNRRGLVNSHAKYDDKDGYIAAIRNELDLGFADMSTSLGYALFRRDDKEFSAGVSFFRGGWTLASSYRKTYIDGKKEPAQIFDNYREGYAWDIGLSYEIGPYQVGLSYFNSKADNTDNEDKVVMLSNQYQINKWVNVYLIAAHVDFQGENKNIENNNQGYSFVTGIGLEF